MKIVILGSTQYASKMKTLVKKLEEIGHQVKLPALDDHPSDWNELRIMRHNLGLIRWCDMAYFVWDQRSPGTFGDFCMCFALGKPVVIAYMEKKTIANFMLQYEKECEDDLLCLQRRRTDKRS